MFWFLLLSAIKSIYKYQLHAVFRTPQGGQREPSVTTPCPTFRRIPEVRRLEGGAQLRALNYALLGNIFLRNITPSNPVIL